MEFKKVHTLLTYCSKAAEVLPRLEVFVMKQWEVDPFSSSLRRFGVEPFFLASPLPQYAAQGALCRVALEIDLSEDSNSISGKP